MESVGQQRQRLKERYALMTEDELAVMAQDASDLTEVAQEALRAVIGERGLDFELKMESPAQRRDHPPEEDDELVILYRLGTAEGASRAMEALTAAGIPSFLTLEVRESDWKRARAVLAQAVKDDYSDDEKDYAFLCPKCRSEMVVMEERDPSSTAPYNWHCDVCGHQWSDEGIVEEVPAPGRKRRIPARNSLEDWWRLFPRARLGSESS
jgi:hypothetical protein